MAVSAPPRRTPGRKPVAAAIPAALVGLCVLGALVRFWRIGHQSFWLDEAYTVALVKHSFGGMLSTIPHTESTPPLYYAAAWLWSRLFGSGAAGLRSLSALFGTLAIPVAYAAARELFDARAGLVAAALVAVNPYFVWYSQEARAYALVVLLAAASLLAFARVLRERSARACYTWAGVAALALLSHYFAAFLIAPEAAYLLYATRSRWMVAATALPVVCVAALAPLAIAQRHTGHTQWIGNIGIARRLSDLPKKFVTGELGLPLPVLGALGGALALAAVGWALWRVETRRAAAMLVGLTLAVVAIPLVLAAAGADYVFARNLIVLYVPLALVAAAGFAAGRRTGVAAAAALCAIALLVNGYVAYDAKLQRDDWRGLAAVLGPARAPRAVVLGPAVQRPPFALYAGPTRSAAAGATVSEIDAILDTRPPRTRVPPPPSGFELSLVRQTASWTLIRYVAPTALPLSPATLLSVRLGSEPPGLFLQR